MQLFYAKNIIENSAFLDETESTHCVRVLRKKKGDIINLTDGKGHFYQGKISQDNPKQCILQITETTVSAPKHPYNLHVAIAPTKNIDRFEWFVEKAVEIGVDIITPLICHYSERKKLRSDRIEKIIISAMKQSIKGFLPKFNETISIQEFVLQGFNNSLKCIAHLEKQKKTELIKLDRDGNDYVIIIGPEGDFHPDEIKLAIANGFIPISLGNSRLRTETAGVAVCQIVCDRQSLKEV